MSQTIHTVLGIDVGGERKGFHVVALQGDTFMDKINAVDPAVIVKWCLNHKASVVAVDAPCGWSQTGLSRQAERELTVFGQKIYCFATPARERAENHYKGFYDWVFNGGRLYELLTKAYPLFNGERRKEPTCIETFPHAIVCSMAGRVVSARPKSKVRRKALHDRGYEISNLSNIDFVDAALCAVAANEFCKDKYQCFGNIAEGFIVVPYYRVV